MIRLAWRVRIRAAAKHSRWTHGGAAYLAQLDQAVPFGHNAVEYATIIKDRAVRRSLAAVGREIMELATQDTGRVEELLDESERKVFNIAEKKRARRITERSR